MVSDPIEQVLSDLGKMRGAATTNFLRLPAPSPFKDALQEVDGLLGRLETDIERVRAAIPLPDPEGFVVEVKDKIVEVTRQGQGAGRRGLRGWLRSISLPPLD